MPQFHFQWLYLCCLKAQSSSSLSWFYEPKSFFVFFICKVQVNIKYATCVCLYVYIHIHVSILIFYQSDSSIILSFWSRIRYLPAYIFYYLPSFLSPSFPSLSLPPSILPSPYFFLCLWLCNSSSIICSKAIISALDCFSPMSKSVWHVCGWFLTAFSTGFTWYPKVEHPYEFFHKLKWHKAKKSNYH